MARGGGRLNENDLWRRIAWHSMALQVQLKTPLTPTLQSNPSFSSPLPLSFLLYTHSRALRVAGLGRLQLKDASPTAYMHG